MPAPPRNLGRLAELKAAGVDTLGLHAESFDEAVLARQVPVKASLYQEVAAILEARGLTSAECRTGCVRCGACSALGFYERSSAALALHPARDRAELA